MASLPTFFPWRDGNRVQLLVDGDRFFPAIFEAIDRARRRVWIILYLAEKGRVLDQAALHLSEAARRGVDVRLLLDDFGTRGIDAENCRRMKQAGVVIARYNPIRPGRLLDNLFRDHRKLILADEAAFVGGLGFTDEFLPGAVARPWRETVIRIEGPCVSDWARVFRHAWDRWSEQRIHARTGEPRESVDHLSGRVVLSSSHAPSGIRRSAIARMHSARRRIWLATAYFVPSRRFRRQLRHAAHRGVDVRILLPGPYTDHPAVRHAGHRFYARLMRAGVRIFEYQPRFTHQKVLLCDDHVSIGSANFDRWNLRWNEEANQEIQAREFADAVAAMLEADFRQSEELDLARWLGRPLTEKWLDLYFSLIDRWLVRLLW